MFLQTSPADAVRSDLTSTCRLGLESGERVPLERSRSVTPAPQKQNHWRTSTVTRQVLGLLMGRQWYKEACTISM